MPIPADVLDGARLDLRQRRADLLVALEKIDAALQALDDDPLPATPAQPSEAVDVSDMALAEALHVVLLEAGGPRRPIDITRLALERGLRSGSRSPADSVRAALRRRSDLFVKSTDGRWWVVEAKARHHPPHDGDGRVREP